MYTFPRLQNHWSADAAPSRRREDIAEPALGRPDEHRRSTARKSKQSYLRQIPIGSTSLLSGFTQQRHSLGSKLTDVRRGSPSWQLAGCYGARLRFCFAACTRNTVASTMYGTAESGYGATLLTLISQRTYVSSPSTPFGPSRKSQSQRIGRFRRKYRQSTARTVYRIHPA